MINLATRELIMINVSNVLLIRFTVILHCAVYARNIAYDQIIMNMQCWPISCRMKEKCKICRACVIDLVRLKKSAIYNFATRCIFRPSVHSSFRPSACPSVSLSICPSVKSNIVNCLHRLKVSKNKSEN